MKKVLILGHGTRSFLSVIRSLGRKGIIVHAANSLPEDPALSSKYISRYFLLPPFSEVEQWKSEVISIVEKEHYDLVIPTDDSDNPAPANQNGDRKIQQSVSPRHFGLHYTDKLQTYSFCES
jgi:hypothetical protein